MQPQVFRMSWINYIFPPLQIGVSCVIFKALWDQTEKVGGDFSQLGVFSVIALIGFGTLAAYVTVSSVFRILWLATFRITVKPGLLEVKFGVLPWNKVTTYWDNPRLHDVRFVNTGFFKWLFRFGNVILIGSEGDTDRFFIKGIAAPQKAAQAITNDVLSFQAHAVSEAT